MDWWNLISWLIKRCKIFDDEYMVNKSKLLFCNLFVEYWFKAQNAKITPSITYKNG